MNRRTRFAKKNARATARPASQGEEAAPEGEVGPAGEDDAMKGIGEIARAIVERLAARRRDAQPDAPDLADLEN